MAGEQKLLARISELESVNKSKELELDFRRDLTRRYVEQLDGREKRLLAAEARVEESAQRILNEVSSLAKTILDALANPEKLKAYKEAIRDSNTVEVSHGD